MNFGEFFDSNSCSGGARIVAEDLPYYSNNYSINNNTPNGYSLISQPKLVPQSLCNNKPTFNNSSGLSLALQQSDNMEGQRGDVSRTNGGENCEPSNNKNVNGGSRRSRDAIEEQESRSVGSDNGGASGDDQDNNASDNPPRKKRYHRHTPQQIQELESLFKECPHPDEKQRMELSRRLSLDPRQVKFWFQNRRTQMKTQIERHENTILRLEKEKLKAENMSIREAMRNPMCTNCGGPAIMGEISLEEQHLRIENARLKDELDRVCSLAGKFLGRPVMSLGHPTSLELGGLTVGLPSSNLAPNLGSNDHFGIGLLSPISQAKAMISGSNNNNVVSPMEKSMYLELALSAMDELVKVAHADVPLWVKSFDRETLNYDEYSRRFNPCIGLRPNGFVAESSRESGLVIINSLALVETLMDSGKWAEMFPCIVARTSTVDVISSGMGGTRNGALQLMHAELQVLSPLVPVREVNFLRFCKQHAEGIWAVVDVSIDSIGETAAGGGGAVVPSCRRLPSGCVVQDMPNGYSKVTWVEHVEYDETVVHQLYRPLIGSGMGFGAQRWVATLQRQCECLAILMSSSIPAKDHSAITAAGRNSMLKLAQRMTNNFCSGVCDSTLHKWDKLRSDNVDEGVRVMTRKSVDDPGEPSGVVVSAAASVWLSVPTHTVFDFLRNEHSRSQWDILSNGGPMQEMAHIAKGQDHGNCVSLLRASAMNPNQSSMLILQETCTDPSGSMVVYAPVDIPAMHVVMNGGDSSYVALLPSGFSVVPDGPSGGGGSLLTVGFQILVNSLPNAKLTVESVETVNSLISCTVQKIKGALGCEDRRA